MGKKRLYTSFGAPREEAYDLTKGIDNILSNAFEQLKQYMVENNINTNDFFEHCDSAFGEKLCEIGY